MATVAQKHKYGLNILFPIQDVVDPSSPEANASVTCGDDDVGIVVVRVGEGRGDAVKITVPKGRAASAPIVITLPKAASASHISLTLQAGSTAMLELDGNAIASANTQIEISMARQSSLQIFSDAAGEVVYGAIRARLEASAKLQLCEVVSGSAFVYGRTQVTLAGEQAEVELRTMFIGRGSEKQDLYAEVIHDAPRTISTVSTRGVLGDNAKTIARGLVKIRRKAFRSSGFQREDVLLLGERAEIDAVPNLEIETDDVRCGHGAAIGRIDREKSYYLMSRGLTREDASRMLVEAHLTALLQGLPKIIAERAVKAIKRSLKKFSYDE